MNELFDDADGLNPTVLASLLKSSQKKKFLAVKRIESFLSRTEGYVAWSGGKDSTATVMLARRVDPDIPVVFFNSGFEFPETLTYIQETVKKYNLNFHEVETVPSALDFLISTRLWEHESLASHEGEPQMRQSSMHRILIDAPSEKAHDRFGAGEMLGLRAGESAGRRIQLAKTKGEYVKKLSGGRTVSVCCPVWDWSDEHVRSFLHEDGIVENPIYEKLSHLGVPASQQRAGLILDGNGLEFGRAAWLKQGWPALWETLLECLPMLSEWSQ